MIRRKDFGVVIVTVDVLLHTKLDLDTHNLVIKKFWDGNYGSRVCCSKKEFSVMIMIKKFDTGKSNSCCAASNEL